MKKQLNSSVSPFSVTSRKVSFSKLDFENKSNGAGLLTESLVSVAKKAAAAK